MVGLRLPTPKRVPRVWSRPTASKTARPNPSGELFQPAKRLTQREGRYGPVET
jgi:hypothetical protein